MNDPYTKKWLLNDSKYPPIACFVTIATPSCRLVSFSAFESGMVGFVQFNVSLSWFTVAYYVLFRCFCYSHLSILFALVPSSVAIATSDVLLHFFFFLTSCAQSRRGKGRKRDAFIREVEEIRGCVATLCADAASCLPVFLSVCPFYPSLTTSLGHFRRALPPQPEAMLVHRQIAQYAVGWEQLCVWMYAHMQLRRQVTRLYTCTAACFLCENP